MYRAYNAAGAAEQTFHSDFGAALEEPSAQRFGRNYVASWETRNLRMAANIREVMSAQPGLRVLVLVGASHKGYLEAYLNQMHDVRIINTNNILR
jgi:pheromone shutdown protein TraB